MGAEKHQEEAPHPRNCPVMSSDSDEPAKIGKDFDDSACEFCERYKNSGLSKSSKMLLNFVEEEGVIDRSVLDLGCGAGGFSVELLKRGAKSSVGLDLSPEMVKAATELASASGFEDRAKFEAENAATASLPDSDIVVLDKVICCYSEVGQLLRNASEASRSLLGFVVPRDDGILKWPLRFGVWVGNLFQKRRHGVLFYLHPLGVLDRTLKEAGFARQKKQASRFWLVFLYKRTKAGREVIVWK